MKALIFLSGLILLLSAVIGFSGILQLGRIEQIKSKLINRPDLRKAILIVLILSASICLFAHIQTGFFTAVSRSITQWDISAKNPAAAGYLFIYTIMLIVSIWSGLVTGITLFNQNRFMAFMEKLQTSKLMNYCLIFILLSVLSLSRYFIYKGLMEPNAFVKALGV